MEQKSMEGTFNKDITDQDKIIQLLNDLFSKEKKKNILNNYYFIFQYYLQMYVKLIRFIKKRLKKRLYLM